MIDGNVPDAAAVDRLVRRAARRLLPPEIAATHLDIAVAALAIATAADRLARVEVIEARRQAGATWEDVGRALGISRQTAHERFRTGPDGLHSRFFKSSLQRPVETALKPSRPRRSRVAPERADRGGGDV